MGVVQEEPAFVAEEEFEESDLSDIEVSILSVPQCVMCCDVQEVGGVEEGEGESEEEEAVKRKRPRIEIEYETELQPPAKLKTT